MSNSSRAKKQSNDPVGSSSFRTEFAGYYPPTDDELKRFVVEGLVVLDTNAVLDLYRFTDTTREEYFDALALLGERLWIPNRVGEEFHDNRTTVIRERQDIRDAISVQLTVPIEVLVAAIAVHAQRHGLDGLAAADTVHKGVLAALEPVIRDIEGTAGGVTPDPDAHPDSDPILTKICALFDGKTGAALDEKQSAGAQNAHKLRMAGHIPPGYRDSKKAERSIGDYLVWKQTITEATERKLPVLLVTNEKKEDWVFRDGGYTVPRVELVREMKQTAGCEFHLVDVETFLALAKKYLAAEISEAAVDEAARVSDVAAAAAEQEIASTRTAAVNQAFARFDTTAAAREALAGLNTTAAAREALAGLNTTAAAREALAGLNTTAAAREAFSRFDTTTMIRDMMARAISGSDLAGTRTKALPSSTQTEKAASAEPATKRAAAKKPGTKHLRTALAESSTPTKKAASAEPATKRAAAKKPGKKTRNSGEVQRGTEPAQ
ncbi:PIN-like domain-containing protein [Nocardia vinacea]|uniref:PIN-like domain-containing protein n=1 Tax=Nocardia vinacea TaxID=96468 RepID=UPI0002D27D0E|nr:PIN-like domain-containing protein [Nocardia vinacea]